MPQAPPGLRARTKARRPLMTSFAGRRKPSFSSAFTAHHFEPRSETRTRIETTARKRYDGCSPGGTTSAVADLGGSLNAAGLLSFGFGLSADGGATGGASDIFGSAS